VLLKIVVCIKRVPDTETRIRVSDGASIATDGVKFVMSPYDEFALEAGLRTKEAAGDGAVQVLTYGGPESTETLRQGLAMGADAAILLKGQPTQDGLATAKVLAAELEAQAPDLILFGVKAADDDQQQVGPMVATLLGRPCVTGVTTFSVEGTTLTAKREIEGGSQTVELSLPAALSVTKGEFEPRFASLKGIMAAKRKPLEEKDAAPSASQLELVKLAEPEARPEGRIVGEGPDAAVELVRALREEAKAL